jgi:zinc transporter ZupT
MWLALAISSAGAVVTGAGIVAMRAAEAWAQASKAWFASFAAGVLVAVTFLHLMPEAMSLTRFAAPAMLGGFAAMYGFGRLITGHVCGSAPREAYAFGLVSLLGVTFHSFLDGVVYSVTFSVSPLAGLLVATGMIAHEFPEGVVTYALLRCADIPARRAMLLAFLASGLSTPLGTAISWPFVAQLSPQALGVMLALAAGTLFYVGATHLLPQAEREQPRLGFLALFAGVAVVLLTKLLAA